MPKALPPLLFDENDRWILLRAVGVQQGTAHANSFLSQLSAAVRSYREVFPEGRPNRDPRATARRILDLARDSEVPNDVGRAVARHRWVVAVAEGERFGRIGRTIGQLLDQVGGLSSDAREVLAGELWLQFSRPVDPSDVVRDLPRLKAACEELSKAYMLRGRRTPRVLREDVRFLVNSVVNIFVDHYAGWVDGWRRYRELEQERERPIILGETGTSLGKNLQRVLGELEKERPHQGETSVRVIVAKARTLFRKDLEGVLTVCSSKADVQPIGKEDAIDLGGARAWRHYCLPCLKQRQKERPHRALWWLPGRAELLKRPSDALGES